MGLDLSFLLGAGNNAGVVQMPNMERDQATALTLAQLSRQNRLGADAEQEVMRARQEQDAYRAALPALLKAGFSREAIQAAIEADPRIGQTVLKESDARRKAQQDYEKTDADIGEKRTNASSKFFSDIAGVAEAELQQPQPSLMRLKSVADAYRMPLPRFTGNMENPDDVKQYMASVRGAGYAVKDQVAGQQKDRQFTADQLQQVWKNQFDTAAQAETGRHNAATEATARGQLGVAQGQLGVARERLGVEREAKNSGKWVNDIPNGVQINMTDGTTRPITTADGGPLPPKGDAKRSQQATQALGIIAQARPIIEGATGSYMGAARDLAGRAIGRTTDGAEKIAKLQALEGALMMAQPRMEGPQSNADVANYKLMAGRIGDPTVPPEMKLAALDEIEKINQRYAGTQPAAAAPSGNNEPVVDWADLKKKARK